MCHGDLEQVFSLAPTPIANSFPATPNTGDCHPLDLMQCKDCDHIQLSHVLPDLFKDYKYRTPKAVENHLMQTAVMLKQRYPHAKTVLEIGSNNGINTEILKQQFDSIIGIDPAGTHWACMKMPFGMTATRGTVIKRGINRGVYTRKSSAAVIYKRVGPVDLIIANNVFSHIDDLDDVFRAIDFLLDKDGAVIIEVQDFQACLDHGMFDMIYHEHLDYHRPGPWIKFLKRFNLKLSAVEHIEPHGGSLRLTATRYHETDWVDPPVDWTDYATECYARVNGMRNRIRGSAAIWGATAKVTTMIHYSGLLRKFEYCVDTTPEKQGRYLPGTDIKIIPEFPDQDPDTVLLGAWNYETEFKRQFPHLNGINPYG